MHNAPNLNHALTVNSFLNMHVIFFLPPTDLPTASMFAYIVFTFKEKRKKKKEEAGFESTCFRACSKWNILLQWLIEQNNYIAHIEFH